MAYKPATLAYFQLSIQWHLRTNGSTVNLHKNDFKLSWEILKSWQEHYQTNTVKVIMNREEDWRGQLFCRRIIWWPKISNFAVSYLVAVYLAFFCFKRKIHPNVFNRATLHSEKKKILIEESGESIQRPSWHGQIFWTTSVLSHFSNNWTWTLSA